MFKIKKIVYLSVLIPLLESCDYLDIVPDNIATIDYAFRDRQGAEAFLATLYSYQPEMGSISSNPALMGGDDTWSLVDTWNNSATGNYNCFNIKINQNYSNPYVNNWSGSNQGRGLYRAIRDCNIFLENINNVGPDLSGEERERFIAEAKFFKAYFHYWLLRCYGPIPLIKENLPIGIPDEGSWIYRDKFDNCVDYIVQLINEAVPHLPLILYDQTNELRRITQPIALAIKAEVLVLAASPLFNENENLSGMVDNRGVNLMESSVPALTKWERARQACKNAIDTVNLAGNIGFYDFSQSVYYSSYSDVSDTSKLVMTLRTVVTDKWNKELIWGTSNGYQNNTMCNFTATQATNKVSNTIVNPTMRMVEMFYTQNGVPIDEDNTGVFDYANMFETDTAPAAMKYYMLHDGAYPIAKINMFREPRFYANLAFDGGYWLGNGRKQEFDGRDAAQAAWITKMLKGQPSGNVMGQNYTVTGYVLKKGSHIETQANSTETSLSQTQCTFPVIRLADLYLLYAEAANECLPTETSEPTPDVYEYVNLIRTRAGLGNDLVKTWELYSKNPTKPKTKAGMREIIRQERTIELAFEGKRFWDVRRWLIAESEMNKPIRGWNVMGEVAEDYYHLVTVYNLKFSNKEYLWPIQLSELQNNPNLIQNPGWQ